MIASLSSFIICCGAPVPEKPAGGSHALHAACGAACCAKRGQALQWEARVCLSTENLHCCSYNFQRQQCIDTGLGDLGRRYPDNLHPSGPTI